LVLPSAPVGGHNDGGAHGRRRGDAEHPPTAAAGRRRHATLSRSIAVVLWRSLVPRGS